MRLALMFIVAFTYSLFITIQNIKASDLSLPSEAACERVFEAMKNETLFKIEQELKEIIDSDDKRRLRQCFMYKVTSSKKISKNKYRCTGVIALNFEDFMKEVLLKHRKKTDIPRDIGRTGFYTEFEVYYPSLLSPVIDDRTTVSKQIDFYEAMDMITK